LNNCDEKVDWWYRYHRTEDWRGFVERVEKKFRIDMSPMKLCCSERKVKMKV
jgi:hypothetical protein